MKGLTLDLKNINEPLVLPTVTDQMGRKVQIPGQPKRIVSLVPSQTELLFYLGLEKEVVGITKFCVHPAEMWKSKPRVGGTKKVHFDKIDELEPDLIIGNKEENDQAVIEQLSQKYPVWMSDIYSLEDALQMIRMLGQLTGTSPVANTLADKIQEAFTNLTTFKERPNKPSVAYLIWQKPYMAAAGGTFINSMLSEAGFINVFQNKIRYPELPLSELLQLQPDVLMLSSEPYPFGKKHIDELKKIGLKSNIILVNGEQFSWYGSRLLSAPSYFAKLQTKLISQTKTTS